MGGISSIVRSTRNRDSVPTDDMLFPSLRNNLDNVFEGGLVDELIFERYLKEAIRDNRPKVFEFLVIECLFHLHKTGINFLRSSLKLFYINIGHDIIEFDRPKMLEIWEERTQNLLFKERFLVEKLLRIAAQLNRRECFEILVNFTGLERNYMVFSLIMNSKFEGKIQFMDELLSRFEDEDQLNQHIVMACLNTEASINDIKQALQLLRMEKLDKKYLSYYVMRCDRHDLLQHVLDIGLIDFSEEDARQSICFPCKFLDYLLSRFPDIYKSYFTTILSCHVMKNILPESSSLLAISQHPQFSGNQFHRNLFFELLFRHASISLLRPNERLNSPKWLHSFCVLLDKSEEFGGFPRRIIDFAFNSLMMASLCLHERFRLYFSRLISTLVYYGYTFTFLELPRRFFDLIKEDEIYGKTLELLIETSGQFNFNYLLKESTGRCRLMTLRAMAIRTIREKIKRPFQKNLKNLVKICNIPFSVENLINPAKQVERVDIPKIDFEIINNKLCIENDSDIFAKSPEFIGLSYI
ncbi:DgyrCDS5897 [Dimorphilus gyrociliatus]|uniref:DgyrCDS5897 n=1 Tax=Dimorphilus gyrociliatus TaxID=2664684 RepID=A0A7I8VLB5_9ANNE|nr:DgyrCDS5897 [Dimorphilus gyrociliatus]